MSSEMIESARGIEFLAWLEVNKKRLIAGVVVVALLVSGFAIHRWRSGQREMAANSDLVRIQMLQANQATGSSGPKAEQYLELSTRHRGTQAGRQAVYLAAVAFFREGNYAESQANFEAFRTANPLLVAQRRWEDHLGGLWEFPGGNGWRTRRSRNVCGAS
jgi:predicted negative regulator of RcsB-dependent stress response